MSESCKRKRRQKVECIECKSTFDSDYLKRHEKLMHQGKHVKIKMVGAPENPFAVAKQNFTKKKSSESMKDCPSSSKEIISVAENDPDVAENDPDLMSNISTPLSSSSVGKVSGGVIEVAQLISENVEENNTKINTTKSTPLFDTFSETENIELAANNENTCSQESQFEQDEEPSASWAACAGLLQALMSDFIECNTILTKFKSDSTPNPIKFVIDSMHLVSAAESKCAQFLKTAQITLENFTSKNSPTGQNTENILDDLIEHDPSKRGKVKSASQRMYLLNLGPFQPKLARYPVNSDIPKGKQATFTSLWYEQYPHLEYSPEKDAVFCFTCSLFPTNKTETAWTETGIRKWHKMKSTGTKKKGKLEGHFSSEAHRAAVKDLSNFVNSSQHIDNILKKSTRLNMVEEEYVKSFTTSVLEILIDVTRTLARQGIAFRDDGEEENSNFHQIILLISRYVPCVQKWLTEKEFRKYHVTYMSPTSQNEFIQLLSDEVEKEVLAEVKAAEMFSVMADTTPDLSHKDQISLCLRYVNSLGKPVERLIDIEEIKDKTGQALAQFIADKISQKGLNIKNVAFQSYDFAANMSGKENGTQMKLSEIAGYIIPFIPCQSHRLNTFIEHACDSSLIVAELFNILESLYVFFTSSTKRYSSLRESQEAVQNNLSLKNLSKTRWVARAESIRAVWSSYDQLISVTNEISSNRELDGKTRSFALSLHKKLLNFDFIVAMYFMKNVMFKLKIVTEKLQGTDLNIVDAVLLLESLTNVLDSMRNNTTGLNNLINAAIIFSKQLDISAEEQFKLHHRKKNPPRKIDSRPETNEHFDLTEFYRTEFIKVLDSLIVESKENLGSSLKSVEPLYSFFSLPFTTLSSEELNNVIKIFPPGVPESKLQDVDLLNCEVEILQYRCKDAKSLPECMEISRKIRHLLPITHKIFRLAFTAPVTTASNERSFSKLKLIKNYLRTTMTDERLNNLLMIACNVDVIDRVCTRKILQKWFTLKKRRIAACMIK